MKRLLRITAPAALAALLIAGCSKQDNTAGSAAAATSDAATTTAAKAAGAADTAAPAAAARVIEVQATDAMKFSVTRIEAAPGEEIQIKLTNVGTLPKEAMGHNLVLLKKDANVQTFANAALTAKATEYIPANLQDQVIAHTKLLGPKQNDTITVKVPNETGEYPYLCSFPAHAAAGMKGVLVVR